MMGDVIAWALGLAALVLLAAGERHLRDKRREVPEWPDVLGGGD
jgi:hypothetical protein